MYSWAALWHQFTATLAHQPVPAVLAFWLVLALTLVMALEGLLLNLYPGCVFRRYLEKMPHWKRKSSTPPPEPAASPVKKPAPPPAAGAPPEPVAAPVAEPVPAPVAEAAPPVSEAADIRPPRPALRPVKTRNPKKPASKKPAPRPKIARRAAGRHVPSPPRRPIPRLLAAKKLT